jgi:acetyl esterase
MRAGKRRTRHLGGFAIETAVAVREHLKLASLRLLTPLVIRWNWRGAKATDLSVRNELIKVNGGAIKVRIYLPRGTGPFRVLQFFHGGGWVFGDLETHDALCRQLCVQARRMVVAVDYRLAPEHPFPTAAQDCLASLVWSRENAARLGGDPDSIVLCGDSAGGNLAAVAAQQSRQLHPGMIKGQVLIYPVTDHCLYAKWNSYQTYGTKQFGLTYEGMTQLWDLYLRGSTLWHTGMTTHELATPVHMQDLAGLPRALVLLAEQDPLHDEAAEYARRMADAGIPVEVRRYTGQQHGFVGPKPGPSHQQAVADIVKWLQAEQLEANHVDQE